MGTQVEVPFTTFSLSPHMPCTFQTCRSVMAFGKELPGMLTVAGFVDKCLSSEVTAPEVASVLATTAETHARQYLVTTRCHTSNWDANEYHTEQVDRVEASCF